MPTYGPYSPGTIANGVGGTPWGTPTNAGASDDARATISFNASILLGPTSRPLKCTNLSAAIGAGETITGVMVEVEGSATSDAATWGLTAQLLKAGTATGSAQTIPIDGTESGYDSYGGAGSMWGATLTESDCENSGFGVQLVFAHTVVRGDELSSCSVDHVRITIYTTSGSTVRMLACSGAGT